MRCGSRNPSYLHVVYCWQVPFIAAYRKALAADLRSLREEDMPRTTTSAEATDAYPAGSLQVGEGIVQKGPGTHLCDDWLGVVGKRAGSLQTCFVPLAIDLPIAV